MKINFNWIGGATFILSIDDVRIAVDPVLCPKGTIQDYFWFRSNRLEAPRFAENDFDAIDLWLITHNHEDHLDTLGLSKIANPSRVISNGNTKKKLQTRDLHDWTILQWGDTKSLKIGKYTLTIEAIPAIHGVNPISALFAGRVNGYYVTIADEKQTVGVYITSDTVYKKKVITKMKNRPIDLLIPNMGAAKKGSWIMILTLSANMLQRMMQELHPKIVIPVHYGTFAYYRELVETIKDLQDDRIKVVPVGNNTWVEW